MDQLILHEKEPDVEAQDQKQDFDMTAMTKALEKMAPRKKVKYAFKKETLMAIRDDLESWQRRFDPTWMLTMLITDPLIDAQLEEEEKKPQQTKIIMAGKGIRDAARESISSSTGLDIVKSEAILSKVKIPISYSQAFLCQLSDSEDHVLVDIMHCNAITDINQTLQDIRKFAHILSKVEPSTVGLLACTGVVESSAFGRPINLSHKFQSFKFLFSVAPTLITPTSLRALLIEKNPRYSLNNRFDLAKQLASSILYVHSSQYVHKSILPENIVIFEKKTTAGRGELGSLYLVGFEKFRSTEKKSLQMSDGLWHRDIYRHPTRQSIHPEQAYQMQHDIYSLGVVLLEIGLWESFISYSPQLSFSSSELFECGLAELYSGSKRVGDEKSDPLLSPHFSYLLPGQERNERAAAVKSQLIKLALQHLPARMGDKYLEIVLSCLRCLDRESEDSVDESMATGASGSGFEDEDMREDILRGSC